MKKIVFLLLLLSVSAYGAKITNVKVKVLDGFGGDSSSVLARCVSKVGSEYDPATLTSDVTSLKTSGEYQDVKAEAVRVADGVELIFSVYRKVRFQSPLKVEGNKEFGESKIFTESGLKDGTLYSEGELAEAAQKVLDYYVKKHYPNARVIPVTKMIPGGNNCNVTFPLFILMNIFTLSNISYLHLTIILFLLLYKLIYNYVLIEYCLLII